MLGRRGDALLAFVHYYTSNTHTQKELIVDYITQPIADLGPRNFNEQGKDAGAFFCFGGL